MTITKLILCLAWIAPGLLMAQEAKVTEVLSKNLSNILGKEALMIAVEHPPGSSDPVQAPQCVDLFMCWKARS